MKIASREYRPADFSLGQTQEMMVTLGKVGFSPEMAAIVANAKSGKATEIVSLFTTAAEESSLDWLETILAKESKVHQDFFGQKFYLVPFRDTLEKYGPKTVSQWQKLGLEPHFLPLVAIPQDADFLGWKIKPNNWYYERVAESKILWRLIDGQLAANREAFKLPGKTVLIDTRLKPQYRDGKQIFKNDNLLGPIIKRLRQVGEIADYEYGPPSSRFGVSAEEWEGYIKPALAKFLDVEVSQVRLERAIEANVIPQLYSYMPRENDGKTNTWVWYEEYFGGASSRLDGGSSVFGGLSSVSYYSAGNHWEIQAFRPLVVLGDWVLAN